MSPFTFHLSPFTIFAIIIFAATRVNAQTIDAKNVMDKTADVITAEGGASATFSMTGNNGNTTGTIKVKGAMFVVNTKQLTVWYDGHTQWAYADATNEVTVTEPATTEQQTVNPYSFINLYKSGYNMTAERKNNNYVVHLSAQKSSRRITEAYVTVNAKYQPVQIRFKTDKGWTTVNISNFKNENLNDSNFKFNSKNYPSAEIIDLR